ncbi:MAG TPA: NotI family restriction endonuclease [Chloroflexia bacterium]|jgi:hypothetical protein
MPTKVSRGVSEVFGFPPELATEEALEARTNYRCPFIGSRCLKQSQHRDHDSSIPFGACSVWHKGEADAELKPYVICPTRFTEQQRVFSDVLKLFPDTPGTVIEMVKEVSLKGIGRIDQTLVQIDDDDGSPIEFNILEIMACSTTSTGYVIKSFNKALRGEPITERLNYGINYRQVLSRMAVQALSKIEACDQWGAHMVWAIQDTLYNYMHNTTMLDLPLVPLTALDQPDAYTLPALLLFIYSMERDPNGKFTLVLSEIRCGTGEQFAQIMRPRRTPPRDSIIDQLSAKIADGKSVPLTREGIVEIAAEIMEDAPEARDE